MGLQPRAMTWSVTLRKAERIGLYKISPAHHWLKHSGDRVLYLTSGVQ